MHTLRERVDRKMNRNRRQPRERGMDWAFVAFVRLGCMPCGVLVSLMLSGSVLSFGAPGTETPNRGGILRIAGTTDQKTLDPARMTDFILYALLHLPLVDLVNGTNLVPCTAKAWNVSPDSRVFTVHLRSGVKFSNGREVVVSDYIYTLERILDPATGSWLSGYLGNIRGAKAFAANPTQHLEGAKALSPLSFSVELEHPDPAFLYNLWFPAMPREDIVGQEAYYGIRPVCTGPYMVQEWIRGSRLKLTRNPHYQGPEPQHFDGIDYLISGDATTHLMMFERGELDISDGIPRPSFHRLVKDPRWRGLVEKTPLFSTAGMILNTEIPPLNDVLVRRAINYAIDRDRRLGVASGFYSHAEGVLPSIMNAYNPALRGYPFDPEQARKLLQQAGLPLPLHTQLWHDTSDDNRALAQGIQWDLKGIGIEVELVAIELNELILASGIRGKVPMMLLGWSSMIPDPKDMLGIPFDGSIANQAFYNNPEVTRLLKEAATQTDMPLRIKLYQRAEEMIVHDAPWAVLGHQNSFALRQPWLKGSPLDSLWIYRFDRVWFEK